MIKNAAAAWCLALAGLACGAAGCDGPRSEVPSPHQGVVELDQRVLAFEVGGRIRTIDVARGDAVKAGQRIATLDDALAAPARAARVAELDLAKAQLALLESGARPQELAALEAQIRGAKANEHTLTTMLTRQRALVADDAAPAATLDELDGRVRAAKAQRQALEHQLAGVRAGARTPELDAATARITALEAALEAEDRRSEKLVLVAPADGTILDLIADPGEVAAPGSPIATLGDREHPFVDVFVAVAALAPLDVGQRVRVAVDGVGELDGEIERIHQTTEFTPRYVFSKDERPHLVVRVRVRVADPQHRVHPGLPAFATFASDAPAATSEGP